MIEAYGHRGEYTTVRCEHQDRFRLEHEITDRDDESVGGDDDAGALAFGPNAVRPVFVSGGPERLRRSRLRQRLDAQLDDGIDGRLVGGCLSNQVVRSAPRGEGSTK